MVVNQAESEIYNIAFFWIGEFRQRGHRKFKRLAFGDTAPVALCKASAEDAPIIAAIDRSQSRRPVVFREHGGKLYRQLMLDDRAMVTKDLAVLPDKLDRSVLPGAPDHPFPFHLPPAHRAKLNSEDIRTDHIYKEVRGEPAQAIADLQARAEDLLVIDDIVYQRDMPPMLAVSVEARDNLVTLMTVPHRHVHRAMISPTLFFPLDQEHEALKLAEKIQQCAMFPDRPAIRNDFGTSRLDDASGRSLSRFPTDWEMILLCVLRAKTGGSEQPRKTFVHGGWNCLVKLLQTAVPEMPIKGRPASGPDLDFMIGAYLMLAPLVFSDTTDRADIAVLAQLAQLRCGTISPKFLQTAKKRMNKWPYLPHSESGSAALNEIGEILGRFGEAKPKLRTGLPLDWNHVMRCYEYLRTLAPNSEQAQWLSGLMIVVISLMPWRNTKARAGLGNVPMIARSALDETASDELFFASSIGDL